MNTDRLDDFTDVDETPKRSKRKRFWCCLSAVLVPVLVLAIAVGAYMATLRDQYVKNVGTVELDRGKASDGSDLAKGKGTNILLLGSDKRSKEEAAASGVTGQRSDVMMLVHISADNKTAYVSSFPRDLYVPIPGKGTNRINSALAYGGVPLSVKTVENYVGVQIDHAILVDFDGIRGIVDTLGGVDVQVKETFVGDGVQFTAGTQHLDGKDTLTFVRQRKQLSGGDFARNANQREVLKAILAKVLTPETLTDPGKVLKLTEQISPYLTVDSELTPERIVQLALDNRNMRNANITYLSVPHGDPFTTKGGAAVVGTDEAKMDQFRKAVREDTMEEYVSNNR